MIFVRRFEFKEDVGPFKVERRDSKLVWPKDVKENKYQCYTKIPFFASGLVNIRELVCSSALLCNFSADGYIVKKLMA